MVSLQAPPSPKVISELNDSSKKRKWEESTRTEGILEKRSKPESRKSILEIELNLETPLPLEWQRCLDIQSGQIYFYNTRTHKRTSRDPRRSPEPSSPVHMSLDLKLNLPCESQRKYQYSSDNTTEHNSCSPRRGLGDPFMDSSRENKNSGSLIAQASSCLALERDQQEMVATVCTRCHMLVMLCRTSPACPNCKFMNPPEQSPSKIFKQRLSLLC